MTSETLALGLLSAHLRHASPFCLSLPGGLRLAHEGSAEVSAALAVSVLAAALTSGGIPDGAAISRLEATLAAVWHRPLQHRDSAVDVPVSGFAVHGRGPHVHPLVMARTESCIEQKRRAWVERQETFKDKSEDYDLAMSNASSDAEREMLVEEFAGVRSLHREEDIRSGRRLPETGVIGRQSMWLLWIEVAIEQERGARAQQSLPGVDPSSEARSREFRSSVVSITASAHTIEALYGEIKYLIPRQPRANKQYLAIRNAIAVAFTLDEREKQRLTPGLQDLFERRDFAVHPYTEFTPLARHPSGVMTSRELSQFNAETSGVAVDCALDVLSIAAGTQHPVNRWITRWVVAFARDHAQIVIPLARRRHSTSTTED